jgi:hypothetical protein
MTGRAHEARPTGSGKPTKPNAKDQSQSVHATPALNQIGAAGCGDESPKLVSLGPIPSPGA